MVRHPLHDVVIAGVHNTVQARQLPGETSESITATAIRGALADAGITLADVDGINVTSGVGYPAPPPRWRWDPYRLVGGRAVWTGWSTPGIVSILEAAAAIVAGQCHTVLIANGQASAYGSSHDLTAPWTRPQNQFVECWGLFTAAEYALLARAHMDRFGTTVEQIAEVSATIRNNGHVNPAAVYFGRGPFTREDILASRMIADPYRLLDCSTTSEGGVAMILTTAERAKDLDVTPVYLLGGAVDTVGPSYERPPVFEELAWVGERAGQMAFAMAGLGPEDVDVCEFYDNFSWEIIHQFELFGFCPKGEGGPFVMDGTIRRDGKYPVVTDGGTMSFGHIGQGQYIQRVVAGVQQLRGNAGPVQVPDARVVLASNTGLTRRPVLIYSTERP
jgi:acetyl-CoA acetyltransferase